MAEAEAPERLEAGGVEGAEAVGDLGLPVGDGVARVGAAVVGGGDGGEAGEAELGVAALAGGDVAEGLGEGGVGDAGRARRG